MAIIMNISELLLKYKTDKNQGTVPNIYNNLDERIICDNPEPYIGHTYGKSYEKIFNNFDRYSKLNILEIGIQKGGSLLAWNEHFPNANIYGVDIVDAIIPEYRKEHIHYIIADVKSEKTTEALKDIKFDIIIDDGSHILYDAMFVVSNYLNKLNPGGYLIVEDCQHPEHWLNEIKRIVPSQYAVTTEDLRRDIPNVFYPDNFLIIIKK